MDLAGGNGYAKRQAALMSFEDDGDEAFSRDTKGNLWSDLNSANTTNATLRKGLPTSPFGVPSASDLGIDQVGREAAWNATKARVATEAERIYNETQDEVRPDSRRSAATRTLVVPGPGSPEVEAALKNLKQAASDNAPTKAELAGAAAFAAAMGMGAPMTAPLAGLGAWAGLNAKSGLENAVNDLPTSKEIRDELEKQKQEMLKIAERNMPENPFKDLNPKDLVPDFKSLVPDPKDLVPDFNAPAAALGASLKQAAGGLGIDTSGIEASASSVASTAQTALILVAVVGGIYVVSRVVKR